MFIDRAIVSFIAGKGGNGCISFRREKFVPRGGPDGGDGGDGGSISLICRESCSSLHQFKVQSFVRAENGGNGMGRNKTGKRGKNIEIIIPLGTVVKTFPDERIIYDFDRGDKIFEIALGGQGGRGNSRFKSATNRAPRRADTGDSGESIKVILELKLIAFAGLVGFPNAGKSTLISKISDAKPKISDYPFTTLYPNLGVVYNNYQSLMIADIPGIIEGAHEGLGMGHDFLKHIERNQVLLFLVDVSPEAPYQPLQTLEILQKELKLYKQELQKKRKIVIANKIDLTAVDNPAMLGLENYCQHNSITYVRISALKGTNLQQFKKLLFSLYVGGNN